MSGIPPIVSVHATLFLDSTVATPLEELRAKWDPAMASQIAAHVTVTYPAEVPTLDLMTERVSAAAEGLAPFRLWLGRVRCFGRPEDGIFVEVDDLDGGWGALRSSVGSVREQLTVEPHVTIVHPRTSDRGRAAWAELAGTTIGSETKVEEVSLTAFDGVMWVPVSTFPLRGDGGGRGGGSLK